METVEVPEVGVDVGLANSSGTPMAVSIAPSTLFTVRRALSDMVEKFRNPLILGFPG